MQCTGYIEEGSVTDITELCTNDDYRGNVHDAAPQKWDNVITAAPEQKVMFPRPHITTVPESPLRTTKDITTETIPMILESSTKEEEEIGNDDGFEDGDMDEDTTTMAYTSASEEQSFFGNIEKKVPIRLMLVVGGGIIGVIVLCCIIFIARNRGKKHKRRKRKAKKGVRPLESASAKSSTASASAPVPKKMEAEKINMMEFSHKGVLVMQDVKGEVKHALDDVKSGEIVRVQYDTGQNEIVTIGSDVDIIKDSTGTGTEGAAAES